MKIISFFQVKEGAENPFQSRQIKKFIKIKNLIKMKKVVFLTSMLLLLQHGNAQLWVQDFDGALPPSGWTVTPSTAWIANTLYHLPGSSATNPQSYLGLVPNAVGDSSILESPIYDCRSYDFVYLQFSHICKMSMRDSARLEFRVDAGSGMGAWKALPNATYLGSGTYNIGRGFCANSYLDWMAPDTFLRPSQSWWRDELFNLTADAGNGRVQFRFFIKHGTVAGTQFAYGWLLENFEVTGSTYDILPPTVKFIGELPKDTIYFAKSYEINAEVKTNTASALVPPYLKWTTNNGATYDSILMTMVSGNTLWKATIPAFPFGTTVDYSITARDGLGNQASANSRYIFSMPHAGANGYLYYSPADTANSSANVGLIFDVRSANSGSRNLYLNSELVSGSFEYNSPITPVTITKIAWYSKSNVPVYTRRIKVYLQATDAIENNTLIYIDPVEIGATLVYDDTTVTQLYWNEIKLATPFTLPHGSNLMVYVSDYTGIASTSNNNLTPTWIARGATPNRTITVSNTGTLSSAAMCPLMRFEIDLGNFGSNSVGLTNISPDTFHATGGQNVPVDIAIINRGTSSLDSCWINWTVNDSLQTPLKWTGNLAWHACDTFHLGDYISRLNHFDTVKIWVSMPNNTQDPIMEDDTLSAITYGCPGQLLGDYTVGEEKYFESLNEALFALNHCGVSGNVRLLFASGTYAEQWNFTDFGDVMGNYTLTVTSEANDKDSVIIKPDNSSMLAAARLENTRNLRLEALTFNGVETEFHCVQFTGSCTNIVINNCNILSDPKVGSSNTNCCALYKASGTGVIDNFRLTNCLLDGGYQVVIFYGGTGNTLGNYGANVVWDSNIFMNPYNRYGVQAQNTYFTSISYNKILSRNANAPYNSWYGLYVSYCSFDSIVGNSIIQRSKTLITSGYGIYFNYIGYIVLPTPKPTLIANNEIILCGTSSTTYGIYCYTVSEHASYLYFLHNSILIEGTAAANGMYIADINRGNTKRLIIKKNIIDLKANITTAYPLNFLGSNASQFNSNILPYVDVDSNNYYSPMNIGYAAGAARTVWTGTNLGWRYFVTTDLTSKNIEPVYVNLEEGLKLRDYSQFTSPTDGRVPNDIEGISRGSSTSWGCYRALPPYVDARLANITGLKPTGAVV